MRFQIVLALVIAMTAACGRPPTPRVVQTRDGQVSTLPLQLTTFSGLREGYHAHASMVFTDSLGSLAVQIEFDPGVPTRFTGGHYEWISGRDTSRGEVTCSSIDFQGGQGGYPSVGGTFLITRPDATELKIHLPTTTMMPRK